MQLSKRQINYFVSLTGVVDIQSLYEAGYLNETQVRNHLIKEEYYKLLQELKSGQAVEKLANDYSLSVSMVNKVIADR
jgi:hypothetical protein